ncbi:MAG: DsbA family oxidoreductase [Actinobacteria bacterium]|nr:DsbA family oxidoreductase [Actinomycetota bacterium]
MQIEVWADVVCPWCYIGKRRLQSALAERGITDEVEIVHRAFQLDPTASTTTAPTIDHLAEKYGVSREEALAMMANVTEVAAGEGLDYHLDRTTTGNTRDAHRLVLWAQEQDSGAAQLLLEVMYAAYFEQGRGVFTAEDLVGLAEEAGLDADAAQAMLAGTAYLDQVVQDQVLARTFGATGVPFFVIDRAYGVSGAQPVEVFLSAIDQARAASG